MTQARPTAKDSPAPAWPAGLPFPAWIADARVRDTEGLPETLGRIGALEVRLATRKKDIRRAQKLRFKVFYTDGGAKPDPRAALTRRDICPYDRVCDHLVVVDHDAADRRGRRKPRVVGVYRMLRQEKAQRAGGFYTRQEFDIEPLLARHPSKRFLELGRSCVHPAWRSKRVLELLWRGVWTYARHHRIDVLIGCASLPGADPAAHAPVLRFLEERAGAQPEWRASARPQRRSSLSPTAPDDGASLHALPPLIKGYLRLGAQFGDGAVVDLQFGVTDVLVIMPVADIDPRYKTYFSEDS